MPFYELERRGNFWGSPVSIIELFYHKEHSLIWFRNGDLNGFWDVMPFVKSSGGATPGFPRSASLKEINHKEQLLIWFRNWDLNGF